MWFPGWTRRREVEGRKDSQSPRSTWIHAPGFCAERRLLREQRGPVTSATEYLQGKVWLRWHLGRPVQEYPSESVLILWTYWFWFFLLYILWLQRELYLLFLELNIQVAMFISVSHLYWLSLTLNPHFIFVHFTLKNILHQYFHIVCSIDVPYFISNHYYILPFLC